MSYNKYSFSGKHKYSDHYTSLKVQAPKKKTSLGSQCAKALLGVFLALGFGAFWLGIFGGLMKYVGCFIVGVAAIIVGIVTIIKSTIQTK